MAAIEFAARKRQTTSGGAAPLGRSFVRESMRFEIDVVFERAAETRATWLAINPRPEGLHNYQPKEWRR